MLNRFRELSSQSLAETIALRRQLHRHPELAFEEFETARLVSETLTSAGIGVRTGVGRTGVVGTICGDHPGPTVLLRADMDALPITEENDFDFCSVNPGVMHACGHDAHTASLLVASRILQNNRDQIHGTVRVIFQPSEEKIPGGAIEMIRDGVLDPAPIQVFGQHVRPDLPAGVIGVRSGPFMASADELVISIHGEGGHAAEPHKLAGDPVMAAAAVITNLQTVISRNSPPGVPSVISIGRVIADGAYNVIPESVLLEGTLRSMDDDWRTRAQDLIHRVVTQTAEALGTRAEIEVRKGYPPLVNHPDSAALVLEVAREYAGPEQVVDLDEWYVSEDFAYYLRERPGCFYVLGSGNPARGITHGLHTSRFTVDEAALEHAPGFMASLAWKTLMKASA